VIPELHPFQADLIDRGRRQFEVGKRVVVFQAATGAGKTTIACHMAKLAKQKGRNVLFLAHRRRLIDQISDRLIDFQVDHGVFMRGHPLERNTAVQVASRDTIVSRCVNNQWVGLPPADLIILDEGRHGCSPEYQNLLANYPRARVVLLDATPVLSDGSGLAPFAEAIECAAPTSQLVRDNFLVPVRCYAPERLGKAKKAGKFKAGIAGDLVQSWLTYGEGRPTVVFAQRVEHSKDAVARFQAAGISAAHVDANTSDGDRDRVFDQVAEGKVKVLSNVGILGEGVDIPALGCVVLWCNVQGRVRFLQACGRVMRPFPGKEYAILIDHAAAVFRHGFPDEDSEWTLTGNADEAFALAKANGETKAPLYCKTCELVWSGSLECPKCGRRPAKPPRSIFSAEEQEVHEEILTECERKAKEDDRHEQMVKHWLRCIGLAFARGGTFGMAAVVWKQRFNAWPDESFPCHPGRQNMKRKVADIYPEYGKKRQHA
jgi:DNA repair protein RadD